MSNEQIKAKELAILLTAFADGKQLQWDSYAGFVNMKYDDLKQLTDIFNSGRPIRIKPETKRIALTQRDLVDRIKEGKTMWLSTNELVLRFTDTHIYTSHGGATPYLFAFQHNYTFLDGTPCYKEVSCE